VTGNAWLDFWRPFLLSPGAAALAALLAAIIAFAAGLIATGFTFAASWRTQRQRDLAVRQAQWWRATMWAADHSLSEDAREQFAGYEALETLQSSPNWTIDPQQVAFISALTDHVLEASGVRHEPAGESPAGLRPSITSAPELASRRTYAPEVYVAAAKTRVTSNRLLGLASPQNLIRLANGDLSVVKDGVVKDGVRDGSGDDDASRSQAADQGGSAL
jgi:hypothetical protein